MKKFLNFIVSFIFPLSCVGCNRKDVIVCKNCLRTIPLLLSQECPRCRKVMRGGEFCPECVSAPDKFMVDTLVVCSRYDKNGLLKKLIERFKYKFSKELSVSLGEILLSGAREFLNVPADSVVIPVPLHRKRFKYRGFNQAGEIAKALDGTWKISTTALKRVIYTPPQAHLNKEGRIKNLKDAFRVSSGMEAKLAGRTVILVDDVCTTGSTLNECAKVLRETGVVRIVALVLARGDRH